MDPNVNYLRSWRELCKLPFPDGQRTHWATMDEIAKAIKIHKGTAQKLITKNPPSVKKQRFYALELLVVDQPEEARAFLAAVAKGEPDHELQRLEQVALAGPGFDCLCLPDGDLLLPTTVQAPATLARRMPDKLLQRLTKAGVAVPVGLQRGDRVLVYARHDVRIGERFLVDQGEVVMLGLTTWNRLRQRIPQLWRSLELLSEPTSDEVQQARHLGFANLGLMSNAIPCGGLAV